jgi:uncharacterized protein RhaS with RHS repeats
MGFYYMRKRYYDPYTSRFVSEDPLGFRGGDVNLYLYAANNPILLVDPFGLKAGQSNSRFRFTGIRFSSTVLGIDYSFQIYDSRKGWFSSSTTDASVSTTVVGTGFQITFETPESLAAAAGGNLDISLGVSKYLGVTSNTELSRGSINLGFGIGSPASFTKTFKSRDWYYEKF